MNRYWETHENFINDNAEFMVLDDDVICGGGIFLGIKINKLFLLSKRLWTRHFFVINHWTNRIQPNNGNIYKENCCGLAFPVHF